MNNPLDDAAEMLTILRRHWGSVTNDAIPSEAWAWITYLEVIIMNALIGANCAGLAPPLVPLATVLGQQTDAPGNG